MRVAIIGGGVTGLALAHELGRRNVEVEVFERGPQLGGLAAGFEVVPGVRLEHFYHHIFRTDVDFVSLADELGISDRISWRTASIGWFADGAVHAFDTPLDVLRFRPLSPAQRVALGVTMLELQQRSRPGKLGSLTVEQFFRRRLASGVYDKLWGPMLEAKWGRSSDAVAAAWLWQKVRARGKSRRGFREQLGYPVGGFGVLVDALASRIAAHGSKVHLATTVHRVLTEGGRVCGIETDAGRADFDAVVSTLPLPSVAPLVPDLPETVAERCRSADYRGVVCHVLVMDRPISDIYWLNVADRSIPLGGVVEHTNFVGPEHYAGRHIAYLFNYLEQDAPELTMSPEDFPGHHFPHLRRLFPAFDPAQVVDRFVFRTPFASPIFRHPYQPPPQEPMPGLWLADTSRIFPMDRGTSECIRLARYVSARLCGEQAQPPSPV